MFNNLFRFLRHNSNYSIKAEILQNAFGVSIVEKNILQRIKQKDPDKILESIKICRSLGFNDKEILECPELMNSRAMVLEQHYMTLEEGGFKDIKPHILVRYRKYFSKTIRELKNENLIPVNLNVAKSFANFFNPKPEDGTIDFNKFTDEDRWRDQHNSLLKTYLKWRLQATPEEIEMIFRIHHMVSNKSVRILCENINIILELGLSLKRLRKCGYVLHSYPKYVKQVLEDFGNIAGGDLRKAILQCPKLFMVSPKRYAEIYGILKEHGISDETIANQLSIFQLSPQTIKFRLEEIDRTPELKILRSNPKFLKLVLHHQRAKSRLCYLQELQMKCLPLKVLSEDESVDKHVRNGKDINNLKEVLIFFKSILKTDPKYFRDSLKKHPFHLAVPFHQIQDTFEYLISIKFKRDAISKVPSILLYPKKKIKEALQTVNKSAMMRKLPISQTQRLNLTLYYLEKPYHFTGNGIWPESHEEPELNNNKE